MRSITLSGHKSRRLDLHQHHPVYKTGASLFGHVGISTSVRNRTPPGGFGGHLLPRSTLVSCPGGQMCFPTGVGVSLLAFFSSSKWTYEAT